jgi:hypothetical protein
MAAATIKVAAIVQAIKATTRAATIQAATRRAAITAHRPAKGTTRATATTLSPTKVHQARVTITRQAMRTEAAMHLTAPLSPIAPATRALTTPRQLSLQP